MQYSSWLNKYLSRVTGKGLAVANALVILFWAWAVGWVILAPLAAETGRLLILGGGILTLALSLLSFPIYGERVRLLRLSKQGILAQEQERKVLARRLHDETIQVLAALSIELERLKQDALPESYQPEAYRQSLAKLKALSDVTLVDLRKMAFELRPSLLDDFGLKDALTWLLRENLEKIGIETKFTHEASEVKIPHEVQLALFRIAQEAISNVIKHAKATQVSVSLGQTGKSIRLEVADNGVGFKPESVMRQQWEHMGLLGMRERIAMILGKLEIASAPGKGCRVMAVAPLSGIRREPGAAL